MRPILSAFVGIEYHGHILCDGDDEGWNEGYFCKKSWGAYSWVLVVMTRQLFFSERLIFPLEKCTKEVLFRRIGCRRFEKERLDRVKWWGK